MNKNILASKTFWFGLLTALAPLLPVVDQFLKEYTVQFSMVWGAMAIVLRMVTKEKVVLID